MKIGDIVFKNKNKREGMIVWKKNNENIGVSFEHYHLSLFQKPTLSNKDRAEYLRHFGCDEIFEKSELTLKP